MLTAHALKPTIIQKRFIYIQLSFYLEKLLVMSAHHSKKSHDYVFNISWRKL